MLHIRPTVLAPLVALGLLLTASTTSAAQADDARPTDASTAAVDSATATWQPAPAEAPVTEAPTAEARGQQPVPAATATWHFYSRESCYDMFERSCYRSYFPDPFCPANPAGQACSRGSRCWVIISSHWADEYLCY